MAPSHPAVLRRPADGIINGINPSALLVHGERPFARQRCIEACFLWLKIQ
jgi:hypothetical protein